MKNLKIAAVTDDGHTLSSHFGMARYYQVFTIENEQVLSTALLDKPHHRVHPDRTKDHHQHGRDHHEEFFAPVKDCQVLLVGGMGEGAFRRAQANQLEVIFAGGKIAEVVQQYLAGNLKSDSRRNHSHSIVEI